MNTYVKYCPNVYVAKCTEFHQKGETIIVTTQYGKEHECIVFNAVSNKDGFFYYSVVRADGFNVQEWAKRRAARLEGAKATAEAKSMQYWQASKEGSDFLSMGQPILVGHHSEKRHRVLIDRNWNRLGKSVEFSDKAEKYQSRAEYWKGKANTINLSMPESIEFYEFELEKAKAKHEGYLNGTLKREHSFSLTYAKKEVNEIIKKLETAKKLWA
jgi:hypothetical protein